MKNIMLREATAKDIELLTEWWQKEDFPENVPVNPQALEKQLLLQEKDKHYPIKRYLILLSEGTNKEEVIGKCYHYAIDGDVKEVEIGMRILVESELHKGYGKKALHLLLNLILEQFPKTTRVVTDVLANETEVIHFFESQGFNQTDRVPGAWKDLNNVLCDVITLTRMIR